MAYGGFVQLRRGLSEHLEQGSLTPTEHSVFVQLLTFASSDSGIWHGNAKSLETLYHGQLSQKWLLKVLDSLHDKGYIKKFSEQGKKGWYPILVNKYEVTRGNLAGKFLSAERTVDWRNPVYIAKRVTGGSQAYEERVMGGSEAVDTRRNTISTEKDDTFEKSETDYNFDKSELEFCKTEQTVSPFDIPDDDDEAVVDQMSLSASASGSASSVDEDYI